MQVLNTSLSLYPSQTWTNSNTCLQMTTQIPSETKSRVLAISVNICRVCTASWFPFSEVGCLFVVPFSAQQQPGKNRGTGANMRQRTETCCAICPTGVSHRVLREKLCLLWSITPSNHHRNHHYHHKHRHWLILMRSNGTAATLIFL